jgi:hypothetical protein
MVEDEMKIDPGTRVAHEGLDNIGLILDDGNGNQLHGKNAGLNVADRPPNAKSLLASSGWAPGGRRGRGLTDCGLGKNVDVQFHHDCFHFDPL